MTMIMVSVICGVILIILLVQRVRIRREVRRVQRAREHEAAIKEFEELCEVSPYDGDNAYVVKKVRHILHKLASEFLRACFAHDIPRAECVQKKRLRILELAAYFGIDVYQKNRVVPVKCATTDCARSARSA